MVCLDFYQCAALFIAGNLLNYYFEVEGTPVWLRQSTICKRIAPAVFEPTVSNLVVPRPVEHLTPTTTILPAATKTTPAVASHVSWASVIIAALLVAIFVVVVSIVCHCLANLASPPVTPLATADASSQAPLPPMSDGSSPTGRPTTADGDCQTETPSTTDGRCQTDQNPTTESGTQTDPVLPEPCTKCTGLESKITDLQGASLAKQQEIEALEAKLDAPCADCDDLVADIKELYDATQAQQQTIKDLQDDQRKKLVEHCSERAALKKEIVDLEAIWLAQQQTIETMKAEHDQLLNGPCACSRCQNFAAEARELQSLWDDAKALRQKANDRLEELNIQARALEHQATATPCSDCTTNAAELVSLRLCVAELERSQQPPDAAAAGDRRPASAAPERVPVGQSERAGGSGAPGAKGAMVYGVGEEEEEEGDEEDGAASGGAAEPKKTKKTHRAGRRKRGKRRPQGALAADAAAASAGPSDAEGDGKEVEEENEEKEVAVAVDEEERRDEKRKKEEEVAEESAAEKPGPEVAAATKAAVIEGPKANSASGWAAVWKSKSSTER